MAAPPSRIRRTTRSLRRSSRARLVGAALTSFVLGTSGPTFRAVRLLAWWLVGCARRCTSQHARILTETIVSRSRCAPLSRAQVLAPASHDRRRRGTRHSVDYSDAIVHCSISRRATASRSCSIAGAWRAIQEAGNTTTDLSRAVPRCRQITNDRAATRTNASPTRRRSRGGGAGAKDDAVATRVHGLSVSGDRDPRLHLSSAHKRFRRDEFGRRCEERRAVIAPLELPRTQELPVGSWAVAHEPLFRRTARMMSADHPNASLPGGRPIPPTTTRLDARYHLS